MQKLKDSFIGFFKGTRLENRYSNHDFVIRMKVRFMFYMILVFIVSLSVAIVLNFLGITGKIPTESSSIPGMIILIGLLAVYFVCLIILFKGFHQLVSHLILIGSFIGIWLNMILGQGSFFTRLDTFVFIIAVMAVLPLIVSARKISILVYSLVNVIILVVFSQALAIAHPAERELIYEFLSDALVAALFVGFGSFIAFRMNMFALAKIRTDMEARLEAEHLLAQSNMRYREMSDLLPLTIFEADLTGNLSYVNKHAFELFGYTTEDFLSGFNFFSTLHPSDIEICRSNIGAIINGEISKGNVYTAIKKDGSCFKIKIFTSLIFDNKKPIGVRGIIIDMTDQIQAERELKNSRDQFISLVNNIPGTTYRCLYDKYWTMLFVSTEIERLSGYPATDFINNKVRSYESIIHPEDRNKNNAEFDKAIKADLPWEMEYRIIHSDGLVHWVYEKGIAIKNTEGQVEFLDGFILDITERKNADLELQLSENRFKHLFFNAPVALATVDANGKMTRVNSLFTNLLGYTLEDIPDIDTWWLKAYPDQAYRTEVKADWNNHIEKAQSNDLKIEQAEFRIRDLWGNDHTIIIGGSILENGALASFIDITDRKLAEQKLIQSEERFRALIELLPYSVMLTDFEDRYYMVNNAFCRNMGYTYDEVIGKTSKELAIKAEFENEAAVREKLIKEGHIENIEMTVSVRNETNAIVYFSSRAVMIDGKPMLLSATVNITEKKKIEAELENYRKNLELLVKQRTEELAAINEELLNTNEELSHKSKIIHNQNIELKLALQNLKETQLQLVQNEKMASLGILTAGVAHEINNPLNFIMGGYEGLLSFLSDSNQLSDEKLKLCLNSIKTGINRASSIVASLNQFSRTGSKLNESCDIHHIIENSLLLLQNEMKNRISINRNYAAEPCVIQGNAGKLHQVFVNLFTNASHAISKKGTIEIQTNSIDNLLIITITDSGSGIREVDLPRITDPFFTTKEPGQGTGLGLYISYSIINEHKGTMNFTSEINRGTTVTITFPIKK